ncbi:Hsp20/alpha crystallin family protein [Roseateles sp. SL47]|uniref:Hsp20/alpha crystallin family protein n=1 Tax=Roseateles sp. SL47 TaxID=2995138 RepID=UPI00226EDF89|nr:Hsp20/alpha crystallin family protein [Roseateles sp. SL47]WAC73396.1 Hsp20/alpha crystallin family protein [Roseateles sp. SL47]
MYQRLFARDLFNDLERLQREVSQAFDVSSSIRGQGRGGYPALNVGLSPEAVEVYAFAPGLDPATISVDLDRGVLSLAGERASQTAAQAAAKPEGTTPDARSIVHQNERFSGRFRRVVSLPDDIDPDQVQASYRDGVLRVSIKRRAAVQPRRIDIH